MKIKMKKILPLAIVSLFTFPMASIAADRAPDVIINAAIAMIEPGYCNAIWKKNPQTSKVEAWFNSTKSSIIKCYEEATKNTSILPKNNPAYEKCVIADFVAVANVAALNKGVEMPVLGDDYFLSKEFQKRFANVTKDMHGQEMDEYRENMRKSIHATSDKLKNSCF